MTWPAVDSIHRPDPSAVRADGYLFIAQYVGTRYQRYGTSREYMDACRAVGLGVLLVFEEWSSQFLGGADSAQWMIARMLESCAALGVTPGVDFYPAVVLVDPNPAAVYGHESELQYFALEIDARLMVPWTGYGSAYGLELAAQVAPHMVRRWGVGPWGFGEKPDGSLPDVVAAHLIQHGNLGYVYPGGVACDPNTAFLSDMGQWPLGVVPKPTRSREPYMIVGDSNGKAYVPNGAFVVGETGIRFIGDPVELQAWIDDGHEIRPMPGESINAIPKVPGSYGTTPITPPITPPPHLDVAAFAATTNAHIVGIPKGTMNTRVFIGNDTETWIKQVLRDV